MLSQLSGRTAAAGSRRAFLGASAGLVTIISLGGCSGPSASGTIHIADAAGGLSLTMMELMRQQKFLEAFGLHADLQAVADGSKILGGIVGGSIDASFMSGFGQLFPAVDRGADLKVLGGAILTPALALFTGKPDIQSLRDLEGRTVGSGSVGALTYQLTVTLLKQHGVDVSKVTFVNVGSSADVFRSVSVGTIDAGVGSASIANQGPSAKVRVLPHGNMAEELTQFTYAGAWTSARKITEARETLVRALAAHAKLYRFVQQPTSRDAFLAARRAVYPNASAADHDAEWTFIQHYKPFATDLVLSADRLNYIQNLNLGFGVQKHILPLAQVADMSLAQDALKLLG